MAEFNNGTAVSALVSGIVAFLIFFFCIGCFLGCDLEYFDDNCDHDDGAAHFLHLFQENGYGKI